MRNLQTAVQQIYQLGVGFVGSGHARHERPHKPILLLVVLELIDEGLAVPDQIEWSRELRRRFEAMFEVVRSADDDTTPENPFYFLKTDGFWRPFRRIQGKEVPLEDKPRVRECDTGSVFGRFQDHWVLLAGDCSARAVLRDSIIARFFPDKRHQLIGAAAGIPVDEGEAVVAIRKAAFRSILVKLYDHQCSACGLRVRIPEVEFTYVDAAHLVPFAATQDDRPHNGICLCKNHHWAMDNRLIAPSPDYTWLVSPRLDRRRSQGEAELLDLAGRPILRPSDDAYLPSLEGRIWRVGRLLR